MTKLPCVLSIAGSDSCGGAGIQADIKAISAANCYAATVITALTAQNTRGVESIYALPDYFIIQQLSAVFSDMNIAAVKIGMLYDKEIMIAVANILKLIKPANIVLDPVMTAKNGSVLLQNDVLHQLKLLLFPLAALITPNIPEAEILCSSNIKSTDDMMTAAVMIANAANTNVLIKGGHLANEQASDLLYMPQAKSFTWFHETRINSQHTHGTGCTLSASIAAYLAKHYELSAAISAAKKYLTNAIQHGRHLQIGRGNGPVHHFYFMQGSEHAV